MCAQVQENKANIQIIYLILNINNSQMRREGGYGKFVPTRVTHGGRLAGQNGLGLPA